MCNPDFKSILRGFQPVRYPGVSTNKISLNQHRAQGMVKWLQLHSIVAVINRPSPNFSGSLTGFMGRTALIQLPDRHFTHHWSGLHRPLSPSLSASNEHTHENFHPNFGKNSCKSSVEVLISHQFFRECDYTDWHPLAQSWPNKEVRWWSEVVRWGPHKPTADDDPQWPYTDCGLAVTGMF